MQAGNRGALVTVTTGRQCRRAPFRKASPGRANPKGTLSAPRTWLAQAAVRAARFEANNQRRIPVARSRFCAAYVLATRFVSLTGAELDGHNQQACVSFGQAWRMVRPEHTDAGFECGVSTRSSGPRIGRISRIERIIPESSEISALRPAEHGRLRSCQPGYA